MQKADSSREPSRNESALTLLLSFKAHMRAPNFFHGPLGTVALISGIGSVGEFFRSVLPRFRTCLHQGEVHGWGSQLLSFRIQRPSCVGFVEIETTSEGDPLSPAKGS